MTALAMTAFAGVEDEDRPVYLDGAKFLEWLAPWHRTVVIEDDQTGKKKESYGVLNGRRLTKKDTTWLNRTRRGRHKVITLQRADELCTYYDLPLWEALEAAELPPRQRTTPRRKRRRR